MINLLRYELEQIWKIAEKEKMHYFWFLLVIFFGFINTWILLLSSLFNKAIDSLSYNLDLYGVFIGILAPELFGLLLKAYFEKIEKGKTHFFKVKLHLVFLGIPFLIVLIILGNGEYKGEILLQFFLAILVVLLAFTCYLTSYLDPNNNNIIDDFGEEKKDERKLLSENSNALITVKVGKEEVKL